MKRIMLRDRGQFKARDVIAGIIENPTPGQGITYADMRKRDRLSDALERNKGQPFFDLEDADYDVLRVLLDNAQFITAKRELRLILDDVANARSPEETAQLKVIEGEAG